MKPKVQPLGAAIARERRDGGEVKLSTFIPLKIKTLAVASGTTAYCSPKYEYMRVDTRQARSDALTGALLDVADVIELASVREPSRPSTASSACVRAELPRP